MLRDWEVGKIGEDGLKWCVSITFVSSLWILGIHFSEPMVILGLVNHQLLQATFESAKGGYIMSCQILDPEIQDSETYVL